MRTTFFIALSVLIIAGIYSAVSPWTPSAVADAQTVQAQPLLPVENTGELRGEVIAAPEKKKIQKHVAKPMHVIAPSIDLNSPIVGVGVNGKGEMDVPSGTTNNVGWYKYGARPGERGTAVLDAHVFAAFSNLENLKEGDDIYVLTEDGRKLHFIVEKKQLYKLSNLSSKQLFSGMDDRSMNLITCAGKLSADRSTYTHRLVVYTTLVED